MNRDEYYSVLQSNTELSHHGVLGQKWGIRRYQNKDGSLTSLGKKRYEKELRYMKGPHDLSGRDKTLKEAFNNAVARTDSYKQLREYSKSKTAFTDSDAKKFLDKGNKSSGAYERRMNYKIAEDIVKRKVERYFYEHKDEMMKQTLNNLNLDLTRDGANYVNYVILANPDYWLPNRDYV